MNDAEGTNDFAATLKAEAEAFSQAERRQGGLKDLAAQRGETYAINPYVLQVEPSWNSRDFDRPAVLDHIDDIARSIVAQGFLRQHPITTLWRAGVPYIRDGECRWRGALRAIEVYGHPLKTVWAVTTDRTATEMDLLARQGLANLSLQFGPLEKAAHYAKMLRCSTGGCSVAEVAAAAGVSDTAVQRLLDLYSAPEKAKDLVRQGRASVEVVLNALKEAGDDPAAAVATIEAAVTIAQINGAEKATAKHARALRNGTTSVARRKPIDREEIRQIFADAQIITKGDNSEKVAIVIDTARFDILKGTFGF